MTLGIGNTGHSPLQNARSRIDLDSVKGTGLSPECEASFDAELTLLQAPTLTRARPATDGTGGWPAVDSHR